ncbi:hypothetical protein [Actinacidiphila guanduensis]|uniref:hypothetical protein n=1 Tax=Actinacidiphila guanduensis TaxID=310781 RepID=UPI000B89C1C2|nr:hypothetical protein [Actinacidiphila guanduensis]
MRQPPSSSVKTFPVSVHAVPAFSRSAGCRSLCSRSTATVRESRAIVAADSSAFGPSSIGIQPSTMISRCTVNSPASKSTLTQSAHTPSPRRRPRKSNRW